MAEKVQLNRKTLLGLTDPFENCPHELLIVDIIISVHVCLCYQLLEVTILCCLNDEVNQSDLSLLLRENFSNIRHNVHQIWWRLDQRLEVAVTSYLLRR